jgi:hypothetical protein
VAAGRELRNPRASSIAGLLLSTLFAASLVLLLVVLFWH